MDKNLSRRDLLKSIGTGAASLSVLPLLQSCSVGGPGGGGIAAGALYNEKYRPQFHFTPMKNWTNDPNGLVYYKCEYHLFFQHNPFGINWGNMTWGHAVSKDLLHWKQLDHAIEPDELGTIYSGSAVVDWKNTAGFQTGKEKVLVAMYTSAGAHAKPKKVPFTQSIAYSNDRGRTWVKYDGNPVIEHIQSENRDPKVIWHEPTGRWVMALYLRGNDFSLFSSKDLKKWDLLQELKLPGASECPDFFPMAVDGDPSNILWLFWGGNGRYLLGSFDGHKFEPEIGPLESVVGNYYAAQTYGDIPESDGRRIQISWMAKGKFPDMPFNQQMSIPCELTLRTFEEGVRLCRVPVREIETLRYAHRSFENEFIKVGENMLAGMSAELFEIQAEIELGGTSEVGFSLRGNELLYNVQEKVLSCKGKTVEMEPVDGCIKLQILVDRTSIEVFGNDGRVSLFRCSPLNTEDRTLGTLARREQAKVKRMDIWKLRSTWG